MRLLLSTVKWRIQDFPLWGGGAADPLVGGHADLRRGVSNWGGGRGVCRWRPPPGSANVHCIFTLCSHEIMPRQCPSPPAKHRIRSNALIMAPVLWPQNV